MNASQLGNRILAIYTELPSIKDVLYVNKLREDIKEIEQKIQDPDFWSDQEQAVSLQKKLSSKQKIVESFDAIETNTKDLLELLEMDDKSVLKSISKELKQIEKKFEHLSTYALFSGQYDADSAILNFRAGAGGTEAQDWTEMILRMIVRYSESKDWKVQMLESSEGSEAGLKSATVRVEGEYAYGHLKSEHGTHRLVRISPFDAEAMRHTSFSAVEVIPEIEDTTVEVDDNDLRIDTFMSSGKGGQSVNTTYSAVRIVHIPTGIMVQCQNEKSQLQNKKVAMKILISRLQQKHDEEQRAKEAALRGEPTSAEWGSQIRNYVLHPYKLVKDTRTGEESSDPDKVLNGDLEKFVSAYLKWDKSKK